jgi:hypothetical protein
MSKVMKKPTDPQQPEEGSSRDYDYAAIGRGTVRLAGREFACAILGARERPRVIFQQAVESAFALSKRGLSDQVDKLPHFLASENLKPFIDSELIKSLRTWRVRMPDGTRGKQIVYAFDAKLVPATAQVYIKAMMAGTLHHKQKAIADQALKFLVDLATEQIEAMVDRACGYDTQELYAVGELLKILVSPEATKWAPMFPRYFFEPICKLKGWSFNRQMRFPMAMGQVIVDVIYSRFDHPAVLETLRAHNPKDEGTGKRAHRHHQNCTEIGRSRLSSLIEMASRHAAGCIDRGQNWDEFMALWDFMQPKPDDSGYLFPPPEFNKALILEDARKKALNSAPSQN